MEAHNTTSSSGSSGLKKWIITFRWNRNILKQRWEIVREDEGRRVNWIFSTIRTHDSWTQRIRGIKFRNVQTLWRFFLPRPRSLHPMRAHQHPLSVQRIISLMLMFRSLKCHGKRRNETIGSNNESQLMVIRAIECIEERTVYLYLIILFYTC